MTSVEAKCLNLHQCDVSVQADEGNVFEQVFFISINLYPYNLQLVAY